MSQTEELYNKAYKELDESYELFYVSRGDELDTKTAWDVLVGNEIDADLISEISFQETTESYRIVDDILNDMDAEDEYPDANIDQVREDLSQDIIERSEQDVLLDLAKNSFNSFLVTTMIYNCEEYGYDDTGEDEAGFIAKKLGLDEEDTQELYEVIDNTPSDVLFVQLVERVVFEDAYNNIKEGKGTYTFKSPQFVVGNIFTGGYWHGKFNRDFTVDVEELENDPHGIDSCYGGFH